MRVKSVHRALTGSVDGVSPFLVEFDEEGFADVDEAVGEYLCGLHAAEKVGDDADPFAHMNVPRLKKYAKENGIDIGDASTKVDILAVIQGGEAQC